MSGLSPEREFKTTASQAPVIVNGTAGELLALWMERTGQAPPPDFSRNLAVQLGRYLEPFMVDWVEREQQREITRRQEHVQHPSLPWLSATIDGFDAAENTVLEFKVIGPWRKAHEFVRWYTPQVLVQMECLGIASGQLCVLQGNDRIDRYNVAVNDPYKREVFERLASFQLCVDSMSPPVPLPQLVPPEQWRSIDLTQSPMPNWGHAMIPTLRLWLDTKEVADMHKAANDDVKALLPDDVGLVMLNDITVKRNRAGAVSIKQEAA